MDEGGYLYFIGRKDDIIKTRGEKVSPREVEDVLHAMPGVAEVAVIGVPDEVLGAAIKAVIRLKAGVNLTPEQVIHWCALKLENFMVPKFVDFQGEFPKTSTGKISKRELAMANAAGSDMPATSEHQQ
jgi:acyl-coenzyme A synthetase/AMP-(fatty) acid ligase